ncbi:MAG: hypothetical protein HQM10_18000 [Candidatus Riflebacteria bacterium]|nr:hypothetical protein [Candidatus Riflebacteria bacterium]
MKKIICLFIMLFCQAALAVELTPEILFNQLESRTEKIDSIESDLVVSSGTMSAKVTLAIQSPDKFSVDFHDVPVRVVFDGERFWLYIGLLNEVFVLDASSEGGWLSDNLWDWVNPKKIVTRLTRKTLFTLFDISVLKIDPQPDESVASGGIKIRLSPPKDGWLKKIFEVGYYDMVFSPETFLPVLVKEFNEDGTCRGTLKVLEYRINQKMPKERFEFIVPPGVVKVSAGEVIREKLDDGKEYIIEGIENMFRNFKKRISEWGF